MSSTVAQLVLNGLVSGTACGALAVSFAILYRVGGFYQFTVASIYAIGAYAARPEAATTTQLLLAFVRGICCAALAALVFELLVFARFRRRRAPPLVPMLASIGVVAIVENVLAILFGPGLRVSPLVGLKIMSIGSAYLTQLRLTAMLTCGGAAILCVFVLQRTDTGIVWRAIAASPELAAIKGIRVQRAICFANLLAGTLAAIPACFAALDSGSRPPMGNLPLLAAITAVLAVGSQTPAGWLLAGVGIGVLQQVAILLLTARWAETFVFALFCATLLFRKKVLIDGERGST